MMREAASAGKPYGLALLDVQMPEMDGWTLARSIQADPALVGTLLIVLTSFGQTLSPAELKVAGIEAYLTKPVKQVAPVRLSGQFHGEKKYVQTDRGGGDSDFLGTQSGAR